MYYFSYATSSCQWLQFFKVSWGEFLFFSLLLFWNGAKYRDRRRVWWPAFAFTHEITSGAIILTRSGHVCVFAEQCEGMSSCLSSEGFVLCHTLAAEAHVSLYTIFYSIGFDSLELNVFVCVCVNVWGSRRQGCVTTCPLCLVQDCGVWQHCITPWSVILKGMREVQRWAVTDEITLVMHNRSALVRC